MPLPETFDRDLQNSPSTCGDRCVIGSRSMNKSRFEITGGTRTRPRYSRKMETSTMHPRIEGSFRERAATRSAHSAVLNGKFWKISFSNEAREALSVVYLLSLFFFFFSIKVVSVSLRCISMGNV